MNLSSFRDAFNESIVNVISQITSAFVIFDYCFETFDGIPNGNMSRFGDFEEEKKRIY